MARSELRFTKIKANKAEKVTLVYEKFVKDKDWDEYSMTCSERAAPSFYRAIEGLATYLRVICELPAAYLDRVTVTGVSISYAGPQDTMGAVLIGTLRLNNSNCPLNLITPHKSEGPYSGDTDNADPNQLLPQDCATQILKLCAEATEYLNGKRSQMKLFDGKEKASGEKEGK